MKVIIGMEILLIFASIFIFRSVWAFLDSVALANTPAGHFTLLILGLTGAAIALNGVHNCVSEKGQDNIHKGDNNHA